MDDVEQAFDEWEIELGADEATRRDYINWLKDVISTAKVRLAAAVEEEG